MKGPDIVASLPAGPTDQREQAILQLVKSGAALVRWVPITADLGATRATFFVTSEPLMFGETWEDAVYLPVKPKTMQLIADWYGASMLTPKLVDEIWRQADVRVDPFVATTPDAQMSSTARSSAYSKLIKDKIRAKRQASGKSSPLTANIGKYWTVSSYTAGNPAKAENYGFFASGSTKGSVTQIPNVTVIQTVGHAHNLEHTDYSQVIMLVSRKVVLCEASAVAGLDGDSCPSGSPCETSQGPGRSRCVDLFDLAADARLWPLVKHDGPSSLRLPSVPQGERGSESTPDGEVGASDLLATLFVVGSGVALGYLGYDWIAKGALS